MTQNEQILTLYKKLFEQKAVLTKAPALTLDPTNMSAHSFPTQQALNEIKAVISYLLGIRSIDAITIEQALKICNKAYATQPFWKEIILDYLTYQNTVTQDELKKEGKTLTDEGRAILEEIQNLETKIQAEVQSYADQVKAAGFKVDATKLIQNYLNMAAHNPDVAYQTLIKNPAYFAPLQTHDKNGKELLSPAQATQENERLGRFLAKLVA